jgi:(1->4)-alpha-D-glucan 1-alpha-D-glucosylmutase
MVHGLAQVVLKLTAPGAPDLYRGTELWDFSLVDPDNRRPVDWELRERLAGMLPSQGEESPEFARELLKSWRDGRIKMFVTRTLLRFRQDRREMFLNEHYVPLDTSGLQSDRIVAYERRGTTVIVPRLVGGVGGAGDVPLGDAWGDTVIAAHARRARRPTRNLFTGDTVIIGGNEPLLAVSQVLRDFPVAVLAAEDET